MVFISLLEAVDTSHLDNYTVSYLFSLSLVSLTWSYLYTSSQISILKHPPSAKHFRFFNIGFHIPRDETSAQPLPYHSILHFPAIIVMNNGELEIEVGKIIALLEGSD